MKKIPIALFFLLSASLCLLNSCQEKGDPEHARAFAAAFAKAYVNYRYDANNPSLKWSLDRWTYEKNHYQLRIKASWTGGRSNMFMEANCPMEQDLRVIIDKKGELYDYTVMNENSCSQAYHVTSTAQAGAAELLKLSFEMKQLIDGQP